MRYNCKHLGQRDRADAEGRSGAAPGGGVRQICNSHQEIGQDGRRTIERRVRRWQDANDPDSDVRLRQGLPEDERFLTNRVVSDFLRSAHQGILKISQLPIRAQGHKSIHNILNSCKSGLLGNETRHFWRWPWFATFLSDIYANTRSQAVRHCIDGSVSFSEKDTVVL